MLLLFTPAILGVLTMLALGLNGCLRGNRSNF